MGQLVDKLRNRGCNEKCILISGGAVAAYYALPPDKIWVGAGLAIFSYVGIAWYDHQFGCADRLVSYPSPWTTLTKPFKPPVGADMRYV